MSNYHTNVPGAQIESDKTHVNQSGKGTNPGGQYHQSGTNSQTERGTVIPGMEGEAIPGGPRQEQSHGKPIVGFLISVSRTDEGEYWVLRQGQNTIGSGSNCNVVLSESLVSGVHAVLAVHRNPGDNNRISIGLMDRGSSNGTFVNGNYIGFNPCPCKNLDKIKIGNYEMLLMLFDMVDYEMKKADNFVAKEILDYSDRDFYQSNDGTRY